MKGEKNVWNEECETLLAEWSEKASCYRWLHGRCEKSYKKWYYCFSIPVIILSTLTGAANVGMDSFVPEENKSIASAIVGGVNIFAGIISTLQNFLKVAELMEGHRIAGVSWGKLQRNIAIELALDPARRVIQDDFLKLARAEYDRLIEAGPLIDDGVIHQFNKKFDNYKVSKPSICNGLDKCNVYKVDKNIKMNEDEFKEGIEDLIENEEKLVPNNIEIEIDNKLKDSESERTKLDKDDIDNMVKFVSKEDLIENGEKLVPNNIEIDNNLKDSEPEITKLDKDDIKEEDYKEEDFKEEGFKEEDFEEEDYKEEDLKEKGLK